MSEIKYVARGLKERVSGVDVFKTVAYFVSKAYVQDGVVVGNSKPFVIADFSSLFVDVRLSKVRKGFLVEDGDNNYHELSFDSYEECNDYVNRLNQELLDQKTSIFGEDKAVLRRHKKDVEYARKFEEIFACKNGSCGAESNELGEEC